MTKFEFMVLKALMFLLLRGRVSGKMEREVVEKEEKFLMDISKMI
jgi:hypothetical protein